MSYLIVETNCRFSDLQWVLRRYGIELQQRATYWRAILHDDVPDPESYVGHIILDSATFIGHDVSVYVELERAF